MLADLISAGLVALKDYIALHTITCLVPAFFLAGAMVTFISKETIMTYMGAAASKLQAFATAAAGSILMAACSCTIIPVASGLRIPLGGPGLQRSGPHLYRLHSRRQDGPGPALHGLGDGLPGRDGDGIGFRPGGSGPPRA